MPHKNDLCMIKDCKHKFANHIGGKCTMCNCTSFEFVAYSSRNIKDILFTAEFKSESSEAVYSVRAWRQLDFSCNCRGFTTKRTCWHTEAVAKNPEQYKNKAGSLNGAKNSVESTVTNLQTKMNELEAAVRRGDAIELSNLQAEIDYQKAMFEAAGAGLAERFSQVQTNIRAHLLGVDNKLSKTQNTAVLIDNDDPFGNIK